MISMARIFGAPESVPAGKVAREGVERVLARRRARRSTRAHDVHHVAVALDRHELRHLHAAEAADAPEVVAAEVDEHDVLGPLLLVGEQLALEARRPRGRRAARARARDRARLDAPALDAHEDLGRGADDRARRRP